MKIAITRQRGTIKSEEALHPEARSNSPGFFIEVSTKKTYRDYYLTNREIRFSLITGAIIGVAIPIARGLLGF